MAIKKRKIEKRKKAKRGLYYLFGLLHKLDIESLNWKHSDNFYQNAYMRRQYNYREG